MALFGTGPALALDKWAIPRVCIENGWHPAPLEAIKFVESGKFGWFRNGQIKMLPEPHVFGRRLPKSLRAKAIRQGLATRSFRATRSSGHYKRMGSPESRYAFFQKMIDFCKKYNKGNLEPAYMSASYGSYQIMGFNAQRCGFKSAQDMFEKFLQGEEVQLRAFVTFLKEAGLSNAIKNGNFDLVEKKYNGGGLNGVYAKRMRAEDRKLRRGKWANWDPDMVIPPKSTVVTKAKDPDDAKVQGGLVGTGGAGAGAGTLAAQSGIPWETIAVMGLGVAVCLGVAYLVYTKLKDRGDALKSRIDQPVDQLKDIPEGASV